MAARLTHRYIVRPSPVQLDGPAWFLYCKSHAEAETRGKALLGKVPAFIGECGFVEPSGRVVLTGHVDHYGDDNRKAPGA